MRCKKAKILLSAALDGELREKEERAIEQHLSVCAACAKEQAELAEIQRAMALWTDEEPSTRLAENFARRLSRMQEEKAVARHRRPRWALGTAVAGFATAMLAFGILLTNNLQQPHEAVREAASGIERPAPKAIAPAETHRAEREQVQPVEVVRAPGPKPSPAPERRAPSKGPAPRPAPAIARREKGPPVLGRPGPPPPVAFSERAPRPDAVAAVRRAHPAEMERLVLKNVMIARLAGNEATDAVNSELSEAGLAVNETIEKVRGTLQKAVDLLTASHPAPEAERVNEGRTL